MRISNLQDFVLTTSVGITWIMFFQLKQEILLYEELGPILLTIISLLSLLAITIFIFLFKRIGRQHLLIFASYSLIVLYFPIVNSVVYGGFPFGVLFALILIFAHSLIADSANSKNYGQLLIPFYFVSIYVIYRLVVVAIPELVFINSKNWISYYLLIMASPYYLITSIKNHKPLLHPALITLILSTYSTSRSGMFASFLLFMSTLYVIYGRKILTIFFLTLLFSIFAFWDHILNLIILIDRYGENRFSYSTFFDDARGGMIVYYFSNIDFITSISGFSKSGFYFPQIDSGNPHNSFLNAAIGAGLPYMMIFAICIAVSIFIYRRNHYFISVYIAIIFRVSTDSGSFLVYFDTFIFLPLLVHLFARLKLPTSNNFERRLYFDKAL